MVEVLGERDRVGGMQMGDQEGFHGEATGCLLLGVPGEDSRGKALGSRGQLAELTCSPCSSSWAGSSSSGEP